MSNSFWRVLPVLLLLPLSAALAHSAAAQADPPDRVARLNYMQGSISYQVSGDENWVQADPNRPLTTGDNLWSDRDSRGEVHIGSTAIRLSSETGISFLTLDDRTAQIQLAEGTIAVHLRDLAPGNNFEIDTPNLALTLTRSGVYLISADPDDNSTTIIIREGEGQVTGGENSWDLPEGQEYILTGSDQLTYDARPLPRFDDFEAWCQERDQRENDSISARYVSRDVEGYYDLDGYGRWESDRDYGEVWVPTVAPGWAPYRMGHWVYIAPWGWTWVDDEPWGFAPFHYGRWCMVRGRWAWVPGPRMVRPVYAPALVAFVGGAGWGVSLSFGGVSGVAWFPLGPRDVYVPGYHCSPRYMRNVNITNTRVVNVTQVTNVYNTVVIRRNVTRVNYMYARNEHAITAVHRDTFVNARNVSRGIIRVHSREIERARVVESAPIAPTRASYFSARARISNARPAVPISRRPVVVRLNPAASHRDRSRTVYTNDSREFRRPSAPRGAAPTPHPAPVNNPNRSEQPAREGFRSPRPSAPRGAAPTPHAAPANHGNREQPQRPSERSHPFEPPTDGNRTRTRPEPIQHQAAQPDNQPRNRGDEKNYQQREQEPPQVRHAPPAKDNVYGAHPQSNRNQNRTQAPPPQQERHRAEQPKQHERRSGPAPRQQREDHGNHKDSESR